MARLKKGQVLRPVRTEEYHVKGGIVEVEVYENASAPDRGECVIMTYALFREMVEAVHGKDYRVRVVED